MILLLCNILNTAGDM